MEYLLQQTQANGEWSAELVPLAHDGLLVGLEVIVVGLVVMSVVVGVFSVAPAAVGPAVRTEASDMTNVVGIFYGTPAEAERLVAAFNRHCSCEKDEDDNRKVAGETCDGHKALRDQRVLNGSLWELHLADRLRTEEFSETVGQESKD